MPEAVPTSGRVPKLECIYGHVNKVSHSLPERVAHVVAAAGFLSRYLNGPLPYISDAI